MAHASTRLSDAVDALIAQELVRLCACVAGLTSPSADSHPDPLFHVCAAACATLGRLEQAAARHPGRPRRQAAAGRPRAPRRRNPDHLPPHAGRPGLLELLVVLLHGGTVGGLGAGPPAVRHDLLGVRGSALNGEPQARPLSQLTCGVAPHALLMMNSMRAWRGWTSRRWWWSAGPLGLAKASSVPGSSPAPRGSRAHGALSKRCAINPAPGGLCVRLGAYAQCG